MSTKPSPSLRRGSRPGPKTDLRAGRTALQPATSTDKPPKPKSKPAAPAAPAAPAPAPETEPAASRTRKRPPDTSRISIDVPAQLAVDFRDRAARSRFKFSQSEALTAALALLEDLDDEAYEHTVLRHRKR